jgi:ATP-dependent DNA helicase RecQ
MLAPTGPPGLTEAEAQLHAVWGYGGLRPAQRRVVLAVARGRDCLAVLPTGAGKSICFQLPALLQPGVTLVVSPLISLMQDQVRALRRRGVAATYLSSTQPAETRQAVRAALAGGRVKLLYVAPERLERLAPTLPSVSLLAVDEAHCLSEWGHDFRPHYRDLGRIRRVLGNPPALAVTATATPATRADITAVLGLKRPVTVVTSFDRPNLTFRVRPCPSEAARFDALLRRVRGVGGSAVIYVPTRNRTDGVAHLLRRLGVPAVPYHAGLPGRARRDLLAGFVGGRYPVVVATSAFGMGIDQPNVRVVVHLGIPARPESYYQQAGRAGRDGRPAQCELLWVPRDLAMLRPQHLPVPDRRPAACRLAERAGLRAMRRYVLGRQCRRRVLLDYLGERLGVCAGCDRCGEA